MEWFVWTAVQQSLYALLRNSFRASKSHNDCTRNKHIRKWIKYNFVYRKKEWMKRRKKEEQNYQSKRKKLVPFAHKGHSSIRLVAANTMNALRQYITYFDLHSCRRHCVAWCLYVCYVQWVSVASENSWILRFVSLRDMDNLQLAQKREWRG